MDRDNKDKSVLSSTTRVMTRAFHSLNFCEEATALTELWLSLPREEGQLCPNKSSFSPMLMRKHLRSVILYEQLDTGELIARVAGTQIEQFFGTRITGRNVMETLPPEFSRAYHNYYLNLTEFPCAGVVERPIRGSGGAAYLLKTMQLPLLGDSGNVSHFVGISRAYNLPKHFTDFRGAAMTASRNLDINYVDIGAGIPDHMETTMARGTFV